MIYDVVIGLVRLEWFWFIFSLISIRCNEGVLVYRNDMRNDLVGILRFSTSVLQFKRAI